MAEHQIDIENAQEDLLSCAAFLAETIGSSDGHAGAMSEIVPRYLAKGDVDVNMELWKDNNVEIWEKMEKSGRVLETKGVSIQSAVQAWWVPRAAGRRAWRPALPSA